MARLRKNGKPRKVKDWEGKLVGIWGEKDKG